MCSLMWKEQYDTKKSQKSSKIVVSLSKKNLGKTL